MNETEWKLIHGFAAMIEKAERTGALVDVPEGARIVKITLSDTFAERVTMAMRQVAGQISALEELNTEHKAALEALRNQINKLTDPKIIVPRRH